MREHARALIRVAALAVVLGPACHVQAQDAPVPATPEAGRKAYTSYCVRCHGINLAVSSSAFFDLRTFPKDDKARFVESVTQGKRAMPAWGGVLKPGELEAIWVYVGSVNGW
ncbi:c-type cytochrome [Variovorax sp. GT1P44]|uniref:c-type cytochrome n=1 Tax=Variovorax sp. GT1P44 TaxID=3443742 RepID=UPI003F4639D2